MRRLDAMVILGVALAGACAGAFVDWMAFAHGQPLPRGGFSMLDFGIWLVRGDEAAQLMSMSRLALALGAIATSALAAVIFLRAAANAAARQVGWLLVGYAAFTFSAHFLAVDRRYSAWPEFRFASHAVSAALLAFVAIAAARFLVIFPRPVDFESLARQSWFGRRAKRSAVDASTLARWMGSLRARSAVMAACHRMLVDGRLLLIVPVAAFASFAAERALRRTMQGDSWIAFCIVISITGLVLLLGAVFPMAVASTRHLYCNGTDTERRRVAWLQVVMLVGSAAAAFLWLIPFVVRMFAGPQGMSNALAGALMLAWLALPTLLILGLAFAVMYGGALDPRVAFTRVTLWTTLGITVAAVFVVLERFVAMKAVEWLALPRETGLMVAGAVIAGGFVPVRKAAERAVTRLADRYLPLAMVADGVRVTKTVAITDLSGYTALADRDEPSALMQGALLKRQAEGLTARHAGTLVKSMGDAVMLSFADPNDALRCISELHRNYPAAAAALGISPLALHSSLHCGEIVESHDGDIYGHTVNLCARLVDAAGPGEAVASEGLRQALSNPACLHAAGQRKFKNVAEPVNCHRVDLQAWEAALLPARENVASL